MAGSSKDKGPDDDEAWLEVLAGRSVAEMDEASRKQAERVRASLIRRRARLTSPSAPALDDVAFNRLLLRMQREGVDSGATLNAVELLSARNIVEAQATEIDHAIDGGVERGSQITAFIIGSAGKVEANDESTSSRINVKVAATNSSKYWAMAACLFVCVGVVTIYPGLRDEANEGELVRSTIFTPESILITQDDTRRIFKNSTEIIIETTEPNLELTSIMAEAQKLNLNLNIVKNKDETIQLRVPATLAGTELLSRITPQMPITGGDTFIRIIRRAN